MPHQKINFWLVLFYWYAYYYFFFFRFRLNFASWLRFSKCIYFFKCDSLMELRSRESSMFWDHKELLLLLSPLIFNSESPLRVRKEPSLRSYHFISENVCRNQMGIKILLVFLISRNSTNIVDDVEVFWLDIEKLEWMKMKNLGDSTLFVGPNCCTSLIASQIGNPENCVYFKQLWRL